MAEEPAAIADLTMLSEDELTPGSQLLLVAMQRLEEAELLLRGRIRARMRLGTTDFAALRMILRAERRDAPIRPRDLVRILGISGAAVTAICERLEHAAFIRRVADPKDGRGRVLVVSDSAHVHLDEALALTDDHINAVIRSIGQDETHRLVGLLDQVSAAFDSGARTTTG